LFLQYIQRGATSPQFAMEHKPFQRDSKSSQFGSSFRVISLRIKFQRELAQLSSSSFAYYLQLHSSHSNLIKFQRKLAQLSSSSFASLSPLPFKLLSSHSNLGFKTITFHLDQVFSVWNSLHYLSKAK
jgi:hypothetical protein